MNGFREPSFGEIKKTYQNDGCVVYNIDNVSEEEFDEYKCTLNSMTLAEQHRFGKCLFHVFNNDGATVYLSYFPSINKMRIVSEKNNDYFGNAERLSSC